jgi:hypothetical protein
LHDAPPKADAQLLTCSGVAPVDGALSAFKHWDFCRETHSFASLYASLTKTGKHSSSLLQTELTYWSQAASGVDAMPPEELLLLQATKTIVLTNPEKPVFRRIMTTSVNRGVGCGPDMRIRLFSFLLPVVFVTACERSDRDRVRPCGYDDEEPNDVPGNAWDFGNFASEPKSLRERTATIHTANDVDWYRATVYRRGLSTEPLVTVVAPAAFTVTAYHSCVGAGTAADCVWGRPITDENGTGCESVAGAESVIRAATHCDGDQSNVLFKVTTPTTGACRKYDVRVEVE